MKNFLMLLMFLGWHSAVFSQINTKTVIGGTTVDVDQKAVPFVSIGVFEDQLLLSSETSNQYGHYEIKYSFTKGHQYFIKFSSVGYKSKSIGFVYPDTAGLKKVVLTEDENSLKTISVVGHKPLIERKTDRYIVNVEGSILANGNTGLEVLKKSPGLWVNNDGSIKIKGNQSVMVMINDVVQRLSESDLAEYLRTLKSEDISKIEIISSPPSEFEAAGSGGIVHIILKKTRKDGLVGSVFGQYRQQQNKPAYSLGTSLNYKLKNLYLSANISAGKDESDYTASTKIRYPNQYYYASETQRYNNNGRLMYRIGATYDLGAKHSISLQSVQNMGKLNQYFDTDIVFTGSQSLNGHAKSEWFRKPALSSNTLNYSFKMDSLGSGLKVIADYVYSSKTELNNFLSVYNVSSKNSNYRNNTPNMTNLYSLQTDYTKVFRGKISFKTGLKFVVTKRDHEVLNENYIGGNWQLNTNLSNRFIYKEYLSMAYASLEKSWEKLSVKAGLRAEKTNMDGNSITGDATFKRDYINLFPSLFINQKFNENNGNSIFFSYSRRLQRPSFADLNPYRLQFDDYLTQLGNPDLIPEYTHKLEIGTVFWKDFSGDIYYAHTSNKIAQLANPVAGNVIEYQTKNFNSGHEYGASLNAPLKIVKWWTINTALAVYNLRYSINNYNIKQTTLYARSQHNFSFTNVFDVDFSIDYRSPYVSANTNIAYQFVTDLGLSKNFIKKKLQMRLYLSDLLNTARERDFTEYAGTRIDFYQKRPTQSVNLSLNYSFSSGKKFSNKKIDQSSDEERRRIGN